MPALYNTGAVRYLLFLGLMAILLATFLRLFFALASGALFDAEARILLRPVSIRNEWGQAPMTHDEMCVATLMQWSEKCL